MPYPTRNKDNTADLEVSGQELADKMEWIAIELLIGHIVVVVLWVLPKILGHCLKNNPWWVIKKILNVISVGVYMRAIFIACSQYPAVKQQMIMTESGMENFEPLLSLNTWIRLEIRVFFTICASGVVFLLFSMFRRPNNIFKSEKPMEGEAIDIRKDRDFILEYSVTFQIFCIFGTVPVITFLELISPDATRLERLGLIGVFIFQSLLFVALVAAIFLRKESKDFTPGDQIKRYLRLTSWIFGLLWVGSMVAALVLSIFINIVVVQWIVSCTGLTLFVHLSIFEDTPPQSTVARKENLEPLNPSLNDEGF